MKNKYGLFSLGFLSGLFSAAFGIGSGAIMVPSLLALPGLVAGSGS